MFTIEGRRIVVCDVTPLQKEWEDFVDIVETFENYEGFKYPYEVLDLADNQKSTWESIFHAMIRQAIIREINKDADISVFMPTYSPSVMFVIDQYWFMFTNCFHDAFDSIHELVYDNLRMAEDEQLVEIVPLSGKVMIIVEKR
jgi:hypothetical protein